MENNEWEDQLRELLGEYTTPDTHSPMGTDPNALNPTPEEFLHSPDDQVQGWKRIEASLNAADEAFDETVRQKVKHYHPKYDPHSWPVFLQRLADTRYLRTKLMVLKSIEVAMVLLLLLSVFNMERLGKLPFDKQPSGSNQIQQEQNQIPLEQLFQTHETIVPADQIPATSPNSANTINQDYTQAHPHQNVYSHVDANLLVKNEITGQQENGFATDDSPASSLHAISNSVSNASLTNTNSKENFIEIQQGKSSMTATEEIPGITMNGLQFTLEPTIIPEIEMPDVAYITEPLASADFLIDHVASVNHVPSPAYVKTPARPYTEFAVLAQADYNALKMPEDHLYSSGREIVFPSKGIMSPGFGAGFTIAVGHPIWALETGVIYNAKDFEPGRQMIVGGAFDNGSIEFEAMKLQIVSVPVQYRYRFDHQGRVKTYGIAGGGFHVIAQSDVDVRIQYHFASLAFGQNPNNDPNLAATIQESRRIREHIRDGAPFSTKSFVSVNAGLGLEYMFSEHKAIFFQAVAQYQIPNIAFSNNNGKHLRSVSLQAGIRGPLGK